LKGEFMKAKIGFYLMGICAVSSAALAIRQTKLLEVEKNEYDSNHFLMVPPEILKQVREEDAVLQFKHNKIGTDGSYEEEFTVMDTQGNTSTSKRAFIKVDS
jgi:hypothetical protein